MTTLEALITKQVEASMTMSIGRTTDRLADLLAEELLRDPVVRARFLDIVRTAFERVWADMQKEAHG